MTQNKIMKLKLISALMLSLLASTVARERFQFHQQVRRINQNFRLADAVVGVFQPLNKKSCFRLHHRKIKLRRFNDCLTWQYLKLFPRHFAQPDGGG